MHFKDFSSSSKHLIQIDVEEKVKHLVDFHECENETFKKNN
jgi:hypothetical protein